MNAKETKMVLKDKTITYSKAISPFITASQELKIASQSDLIRATDILSHLNQFNDKIQEEKERITKPLLEALRVERGRWKQLEETYKNSINTMRTKITDYESTLQQIIEKEEKQITADLEKGIISPEEILERVENMQEENKKIEGKTGSISFIDVLDFEIMDIALIFSTQSIDFNGKATYFIDYDLLNKYIQPNLVEIRLAMKNGVRLNGIRYFTKKVIRNNR